MNLELGKDKGPLLARWEEDLKVSQWEDRVKVVNRSFPVNIQVNNNINKADLPRTFRVNIRVRVDLSTTRILILTTTKVVLIWDQVTVDREVPFVDLRDNLRVITVVDLVTSVALDPMDSLITEALLPVNIKEDLDPTWDLDKVAEAAIIRGIIKDLKAASIPVERDLLPVLR